MIATLIHLDETSSTNTYAIELIKNKKPSEGSVIVSDFQSGGKGTDTNTWESERGKNLTFSLILYPQFTADRQFMLNRVISTGICDFLKAELNQNNIKIKWPNDIYIADKKVCGILIQNSITGNELNYMIVGIGLNINQTIFTSDAPNPVSMKMISGTDYDLNELLHKLLGYIFDKYASLKSVQSQQIESEYHNSLYRMMEWHNFTVNGSKITARIIGTNAYGQLELETKANGVKTCDLKEVKFII